MLKLYDYPDCPFCQKTRVVLAEKDLEYEKVFVDLRKQEQKTPEFLRMNPYGKVPVLIDEDEVIYDSTIINEYLEEEYPLPRLMRGLAGRATGAAPRGLLRQLLHPPTTMLLAQLRKPQAEQMRSASNRHARSCGGACTSCATSSMATNTWSDEFTWPMRPSRRDGPRAPGLRVRAGARAGAGVARSHPLPPQRPGSRTVVVTQLSMARG